MNLEKKFTIKKKGGGGGWYKLEQMELKLKKTLRFVMMGKYMYRPWRLTVNTLWTIDIMDVEDLH